MPIFTSPGERHYALYERTSALMPALVSRQVAFARQNLSARKPLSQRRLAELRH